MKFVTKNLIITYCLSVAFFFYYIKQPSVLVFYKVIRILLSRFYSASLRIPALHEAKEKNAVFYILLNIFITRSSFKILRGVFFQTQM